MIGGNEGVVGGSAQGLAVRCEELQRLPSEEAEEAQMEEDAPASIESCERVALRILLLRGLDRTGMALFLIVCGHLALRVSVAAHALWMMSSV